MGNSIGERSSGHTARTRSPNARSRIAFLFAAMKARRSQNFGGQSSESAKLTRSRLTRSVSARRDPATSSGRRKSRQFHILALIDRRNRGVQSAAGAKNHVKSGSL